jgi:hypothetical protein
MKTILTQAARIGRIKKIGRAETLKNKKIHKLAGNSKFVDFTKYKYEFII